MKEERGGEIQVKTRRGREENDNTMGWRSIKEEKKTRKKIK